MSSKKDSPKPRHKYERRFVPDPLIFNVLLPGVVLLLSLLVVMSLVLGGRGDIAVDSTGVSTTPSLTEIPQTGPETETTLPPATWETTEPSQPTEATTAAPTDATEPEEQPGGTGELTVEKFTGYSGQYLEDGSGDQVKNVLSLLITNNSGKFLDYATLTYETEGKTATFVVTGLPAGRSAWVMELGRMSFSGSGAYQLVSCASTYRDSVISESSRVNITADGNMLTATNISEETLEDVYVYYRRLHTDGNYLGGVSYRVDFGTLAPGDSMEVQTSKYDDTAQIIRTGWKEE